MELAFSKKGEPWKVKLARRLRAETVQSVAWKAERLKLGSRNYANHLHWKSARWKATKNKN